MREIVEKQLEEVLKISEQRLVLLDFYADWCMPCQILKPILEKIEKTYKEEIEIFKVNIDKNEKLVELFDIMSIPTVVLIKNGEEKDRFVGIRREDDIKEWVEKRMG